ncbi:hypothetical protein G3I40_12335 [Streptomyces sp. SID14478]|uniref:hypothetical protein n=1 Tax=Streptomyces sp. SID14478 TaxID=2706073 RepID=UPI0013DC0DF0|nr:hypothetical protein [Streptomyces sp. SID14478]NEB76003.1 hypothetical protein [Streptomyces sp. SID14478]
MKKSRLAEPAARHAPAEDRRCVDCGTPGREVVAELPRLSGPARAVYACTVHAARRGARA